MNIPMNPSSYQATKQGYLNLLSLTRHFNAKAFWSNNELKALWPRPCNIDQGNLGQKTLCHCTWSFQCPAIPSPSSYTSQSSTVIVSFSLREPLRAISPMFAQSFAPCPRKCLLSLSLYNFPKNQDMPGLAITTDEAPLCKYSLVLTFNNVVLENHLNQSEMAPG